MPGDVIWKYAVQDGFPRARHDPIRCNVPAARPECAADRFEHTLPAVGAVDVAGAQNAAFQVAELVEYEQRMVADAFVMAIPDAHLLLAMGRDRILAGTLSLMLAAPLAVFAQDSEELPYCVAGVDDKVAHSPSLPIDLDHLVANELLRASHGHK
jgi:hypothetical protein